MKCRHEAAPRRARLAEMVERAVPARLGPTTNTAGRKAGHSDHEPQVARTIQSASRANGPRKMQME